MAQEVDLVPATGGAPLWRLEVAGSWLGRLRGLMFRRSLDSGVGLYLPGTNSVHMMFMRFPIDVLFIGAPRTDGARPVVGLRSGLRPWIGVVWWARGDRGAVELDAGALAGAALRE
ncbi:MAG: DUF192 domain-containing protein, partial [Chloroflexota bacterium]